MWKKLLVPYDFSPCAARALQSALELAGVHGAELALLHVSDLPANLPPDILVTPIDATAPLRVDDYTTGGARRLLETIAEPLRREGRAVRTLAVTGDVAEQILSVAGELGANAIVIGTHGREGLSHVFPGSVAEKVARGASVPVVCIRTRAHEAKPTREQTKIQDELAG